MTLTINDTTMTSDHTPHTAVTAMTIADTVAERDLQDRHRLWPRIQSWTEEPTLAARGAIAMATPAPSGANRQRDPASRQPDHEAAD